MEGGRNAPSQMVQVVRGMSGDSGRTRTNPRLSSPRSLVRRKTRLLVRRSSPTPRRGLCRPRRRRLSIHHYRLPLTHRRRHKFLVRKRSERPCPDRGRRTRGGTHQYQGPIGGTRIGTEVAEVAEEVAGVAVFAEVASVIPELKKERGDRRFQRSCRAREFPQRPNP